MRAVHGSTVLQPSDANQTAKLVAQMVDTSGISFLRTLRPKTPVIYDAEEDFPIGGSKTLTSSEDDEVTVVGSGITVHEAMKAADILAGENVSVRVVDCYSIKPVDTAGIGAAVRSTNNRLVVVEDHWPEGGVGEAVLSALVETGSEPVEFRHLAVTGMPGSGKSEELMNSHGIDADHIAAAVRDLLGR
jgi:transketolase